MKLILKGLGCVIISVIVFLTLNSLIPNEREAEIYNSTIRLHVLANSDTEEDQKLKLKVRDALLSKMVTYEAKSKSEALEIIEENKEELIKIAEDVVKNEGYEYEIDIDIGNESYPTRYYEDFALPAGIYTSVRVIIGKGEGQNWWCVLFPPLCLSSAIEYDSEEMVDAGLTKDQYSIITGSSGKYRVKFKLFEMASQLFGFKYD